MGKDLERRTDSSAIGPWLKRMGQRGHTVIVAAALSLVGIPALEGVTDERSTLVVIWAPCFLAGVPWLADAAGGEGLRLSVLAAD